ncbi:MAG: nitrile hydratase subunit beta [Alphaproteobacteria bacterium]|nr:nitrile hydratase subunit beta [Alphaproteobacteria bacterium]
MAEPFEPGDAVRVREDYPPGHIRTPVFIRGKEGVVTRTFGRFDNPEITTYELEGPQKTLYEVRFRQVDIWPDYDGSPSDTLDVDIYEHWLEKA